MQPASTTRHFRSHRALTNDNVALKSRVPSFKWDSTSFATSSLAQNKTMLSSKAWTRRRAHIRKRGKSAWR